MATNAAGASTARTSAGTRWECVVYARANFVDTPLKAQMVRLAPMLLLLACGADPGRPVAVEVARSEPVTGPDGTTHWIIECHRRSANCLKQAGKPCPGGYTVLERDGQTTSEFHADTTSGAAAYGNAVVGRSQTSVRESRNYRGSLLIKCKYREPPAAASTASAAITASTASSPVTTVFADAGVGEEMRNPYR